MELSNKAAYLKGLADGGNFDKNTAEGKIIYSLLDLVRDMAKTIEDLDSEVDFVNDKLDEHEEVTDLLGEHIFGGEDDDFNEEDSYQTVCPKCGSEVYFTEDDLDDIDAGNFCCPECGTVIRIDFDGCDCGCEHDE